MVLLASKSNSKSSTLPCSELKPYGLAERRADQQVLFSCGFLGDSRHAEEYMWGNVFLRSW